MRDILNLYDCNEAHDWKSRGGCNAGCCDGCACSVPVHECTRCGDCDYGQNEEARAVITECWRRNGKPAERMADTELLAESEKFAPFIDGLPWDEIIRRDEIRKEVTRRGLSLPVAALGEHFK